MLTRPPQFFRLVLLAFLAGASCCFAQNPDFDALARQGITYTNERMRDVPWSIHYVKIDRTRPEYEWTVTKAGGRVIGLGTLSDQVNSLPPDIGHPVAAINGDFFQTDSSPYRGDPRGLMIMRGELLSAPTSNIVFWVDAKNQPHIEQVMSEFKVTWPDGSKTPFGLNEARDADAAVLYTPSLGRSTLTRGGHELVLERSGTGPWLPLEVGRVIMARVREVRETNNTVLAKDTLILSLGPRLLQQLAEVKVGDVLKLSTATEPFLGNVKTAIGGGPKLVAKGKATPPEKPDAVGKNVPYAMRTLYERHPRSAIGFNQTHYFLLEVDGRQRGLSVGMTLEEMADYLQRLGCTDAMNLDGGASSQLMLDGRIMNSPSAGRERATATGLVLVEKKER